MSEELTPIAPKPKPKPKTVQQLLQELLLRDMDDLAVQQDQQRDHYTRIPALLERVFLLTGIEQTDLVRLSVRTAWLYKDMKWYDVLEILRIFYQNKHNAEEAQKEG